ncbi:PepSY domain-containing protein [uncultured Paraglaciecola sp.]|mgnify:CR=1 FL=1|uniref:PepSY-associated TM helix domain-containing protein n=1 Tax=uncultured Paraglaciecola sp. TaxID=1765024 RepID=UPI00261A2C0E|nr:PepSY-associated TM helix domain-containing protein [uncultured Paraglaciecola sp.]
MNRKSWYKWHSLAGIKLSILICFILLTGTLAVISHEIDWLINSSQRVLPSVSSSNINWSQVYKSAKKQDSKAQVASISAPIDDWFAVEVIRVDAQKQRYREFYHPATGQYQGQGRWYNWQRFFRMSHRHLMMPTIYGVTIVCIVGLVMFFSLISGFFLIPQWWKGFFRKPRTNNKKTFWNDCHRLFGLWSSWLLLTVCITGIWYLIEVWGGNASFPEQTIPAANKVEQGLIKTSPAVFEKVIKSVSTYHDLNIKRIILPTKKEQLIIVQGQNDTLLVRDRANNVIFDGTNGYYLTRRIANEQSLHVRISEAADPLHFGVWGGIYTKIFYFIFGSILCALAISGTYLYGLRHYNSHRDEFYIALKAWKASWQGTGYWKWVSLVLIVVMFILTSLIFTNSVLI